MTRDSVGKILKGQKTIFYIWLSSTHYVFYTVQTAAHHPYLDLEGSLEAAGKEATKRSHNGGKGGESDAVDLEWIEAHCGL